MTDKQYNRRECAMCLWSGIECTNHNKFTPKIDETAPGSDCTYWAYYD